jgi:hypothetical protein
LAAVVAVDLIAGLERAVVQAVALQHKETLEVQPQAAKVTSVAIRQDQVGQAAAVVVLAVLVFQVQAQLYLVLAVLVALEQILIQLGFLRLV